MKCALSICLVFFSSALRAQCINVVPGAIIRLSTIENAADSLPPGKTPYRFTADYCPAEGYYTIKDSVPACFGNSWGIVPAKGMGGKFMLINAGAFPGDIYVDTIKDLCGGTNYRAGESIVHEAHPNSCGGNPIWPNLTISVETLDGTILAAVNTGDQYRGSDTIDIDYGFDFITPPSTGTVVFRVRSDLPGGCGNVILLTNIGFIPCVPDVRATLEKYFCVQNSSFNTLSATFGNVYAMPEYQWQVFNGTTWEDIPGANNIKYTPGADSSAEVEKYRFTMAAAGNIGNMACRAVSDTLLIYPGIPGTPVIASSNSPVCGNKQVNLSATGGASYQWSGPAGFTSKEPDPSVIAGNATAGQYTVVVSDGNGCQSTATTTVSILPAPAIVISPTQNICLGDSVTLQASGGNVYGWLPIGNLSDPGISDPMAKPTGTTRYVVSVTNKDLCTDTAGVLVAVETRPIISAGPDQAILKGQSVRLDGRIENPANVTFAWAASPSLQDDLSLDPFVDPQKTTAYILTATSSIGCGTSSDTVLVKVYNGLSVPNAFTPNGDGHNDTWHIPALQAFPDAVVSVFNRNGTKIFESKGGNKDWNGKFNNVVQPQGVYPYLIDLKNGSPIIKGVVILMR